MKRTFALLALVLFAGLGARVSGAAEHQEQVDAVKPQSADKDLIEKQKASYPLKTCVVSGEKLDGEMGAAVDYVYKDRLVRFCCKGCVKKFEKDPETYLKKIDDAAKAVSEKNSATPKANQHAGGHGCCN